MFPPRNEFQNSLPHGAMSLRSDTGTLASLRRLHKVLHIVHPVIMPLLLWLTTHVSSAGQQHPLNNVPLEPTAVGTPPVRNVGELAKPVAHDQEWQGHAAY